MAWFYISDFGFRFLILCLFFSSCLRYCEHACLCGCMFFSPSFVSLSFFRRLSKVFCYRATLFPTVNSIQHPFSPRVRRSKFFQLGGAVAPISMTSTPPKIFSIFAAIFVATVFWVINPCVEVGSGCQVCLTLQGAGDQLSGRQ